jgi:cell division protein FtsW
MGETVLATAEDRRFDRPLFVCVFLLLGFGVVMVYSASAVRAAYEQNNPSHFLVRQVVYALLGLVVLFVGASINYSFYKKIVYPFLGLSVLGLILCFIPGVGLKINHAYRWINAGPTTIQPAEVVKFAMVLWLSYSLSKKHDKIRSFSIGFLPHLLLPGGVICLCLLQPDFGTSVVIALTTFCLIFVAGANIRYMFVATILTFPIVYYLVWFKEYRRLRVMVFLDPIADRFGSGYQLTQSLFGFSSGGFWGRGIGDGLQKFFFLPEAHNDFIGSIIGEELGIIGIWIMLAIYLVILVRGILIAVRARDEFGTYVAFGITVLISVQTLANLGVAMGLLPTKGLNLPFISAGGSALVVALFSVGVLLNISKGTRSSTVYVQSEQVSSGNYRRSPGMVAAGVK